MTEETFIQVMWHGFIVLGFVGTLLAAAAIYEWFQHRRSRRRHFVDWDWTAETHRKIAARGMYNLLNGVDNKPGGGL